MKRFLTFEKRAASSAVSVVMIRILAVAAAIVTAVIFLFAVGKTPLQVGDVLYSMFVQTFFTEYGIVDVLVKSIPLIITSLGVAIAFRMKLWNIGGEGQIAMGAFAAAGVAMLFPNLPGVALIPAMAAAAVLAGALWAAIAAVPKAWLGVNETITTLMLNYVALRWLQYLITGPWKDPAQKGFPMAPPVPAGGRLPVLLQGSDLHLGLIVALILAAAYFFLINRSRWGYEIRVVGESAPAAEYAGINVRRNTVLVLLVSGAIAGLAGMSELSGLYHRLETNISGGYGYTAIIIAWLARLNPWGVVAMSVFMSALLVGGKYAQTAGISDAVSVMIQGIILFFVLGCDVLAQFRVRIHLMRKGVR